MNSTTRLPVHLWSSGRCSFAHFDGLPTVGVSVPWKLLLFGRVENFDEISFFDIVGKIPGAAGQRARRLAFNSNRLPGTEPLGLLETRA